MTQDESIEFEELEGETELTPPEVYAANLVEWAVEHQASDLFISDTDRSITVSMRRLGRIEPIRRLACDYGRRLQGHLRVLAGGDVGETMRPTEGRGVIGTPGGREVDMRLSTMPTLFGQDVAIRLFDPASGVRSLDALGYDQTELQIVREMLQQPSGMMLVAGPVASGKSSTLYALVDALNDGTRKIHTLEDPIEHAIPGVMQSQINERAGVGFNELLSAVLRHSPDVIMIGEIRDARTASTALRAGASGQLVLATIHAKSAAEAVDSLLQFDADPKSISQALLGVINQRLVRQLCTDCRQTIDEETPDVTKRVQPRLGDLPPHYWRAPGCDVCFGKGFSNLTCAPEILAVDRNLKGVIAGGSGAIALEDAAKEQGMLTMAESLAARVYRGETTALEAHRMIPAPQFADLTIVGQ
ncbi:MAG: GspE/PulE family protein [Rubripirellula sp.]